MLSIFLIVLEPVSICFIVQRDPDIKKHGYGLFIV